MRYWDCQAKKEQENIIVLESFPWSFGLLSKLHQHRKGFIKASTVIVDEWIMDSSKTVQNQMKSLLSSLIQ